MPPALEQFHWRVGNLARTGGVALISGDPGCGKSVAFRLLAERLATEHPQPRPAAKNNGVPLEPFALQTID